MPIYRRVLYYYQPFWAQTLIGLLLSLCGIGLNLLKPWPFKIIVDKVLPGAGTEYYVLPHLRILAFPGLGRSGILLVLCLALVVLQFLWGLTNWLTNYIFVKI